MPVRNVRVEGLKEIEAKLDAEFLLQPEMDVALESFRKRFERQGKKLGAKRNTLMAKTAPLSVTVESTLNYPRTKGTAWGRKNTSIAKAMAGRVVKKAIQAIGERWSENA